MSKPFSDRLAALVEERESQLVLGLDPDPAALWPEAVENGGAGSGAAGDAPAEQAAAAVVRHCRAAIEAAGTECVAVKLQLACFERLGAAGWAALAQTATAARDNDLLVIADGKRGDVPVTAAAYAQALLGSTPSPWGDIPGLGADAITVNPLLGSDTLTPFAEVAAARGASLFVLCRTSNPGASEIQDLSAGDGGTVSDRIAATIGELGAPTVGDSGLAAIGAVVGATAPGHLARLRAAMPAAIFLLPGVGAQGGKVDDLAPAFADHVAGGLVTVSRSLVGAYREHGGEPRKACAAAARQLRDHIWNMAVAGRR